MLVVICRIGLTGLTTDQSDLYQIYQAP